ncbi:MAG: hypothetical protein R2707_09285 [Acidimicrobiales bacterium]
MSPAEREARATEIALATEFRAAIDDARDRIAAVLEPARPTAAFLAALRDEVQRAVDDPSSVPYPELADADAYWEATVKPQSRSLRDNVTAIVEWLEQRIITTMEVAEADLKSLVDNAAGESGPDPVGLRVLVAEAVGARCVELHHQMAEMLSVLPTDTVVAAARSAGEDAMRACATADVESLKTAYLRDAGGDDAHQQYAAQQWSETFAERVNHRQSMLAAQAPWRHQEFALVGYERARAEIERLVEAATARLQAPLRGIPDLLLERYDAAVGAAVDA